MSNKLTCKKHGKRVWVNPESQIVHHRSEDVQCDTDFVIFHGTGYEPRGYGLNSFSAYRCSYCGVTKYQAAETTEICNERWNTSRDSDGQPHVYLG